MHWSDDVVLALERRHHCLHASLHGLGIKIEADLGRIVVAAATAVGATTAVSQHERRVRHQIVE